MKTTIIKNCIPIDIHWLTIDDIAWSEDAYLNTWYNDVKMSMAYLYMDHRDTKCFVCGNYYRDFDVHHAIITRQNIRGLKVQIAGIDHKKTRLLLITNVLNCIPLHNKCHLEGPPKRENVWEYQVSFFGEDLMRRWYDSIPWKVGPPRRF